MGLADSEVHEKVGLGRQEWQAGSLLSCCLTSNRRACRSFYSKALRICVDVFSAVAGMS